MTNPTDRPNLDRLRDHIEHGSVLWRSEQKALVDALTDVLALAERLSHGNLLRADYSDGLKDAAEQIRRAITNHVTPDAPASEVEEEPQQSLGERMGHPGGTYG